MRELELLRQFAIFPTSVIHVGANSGQEVQHYYDAGFTRAIYIEPIAEQFAKLATKVADKPGHTAVQALCADVLGREVKFNVASNGGQSSSIFELGNHAKLYPNVTYIDTKKMITTTIDDIVVNEEIRSEIGLLVMDVQGAELLVLRGARSILPKLKAIYCEVSDIPLYSDGCVWPEISEFLSEYDFKLKHLNIKANNWGMALYVKEGSYQSPLRPAAAAEERGLCNISRGKPARQSSHLAPHSTRDDAAKAVNGNPNGRFSFHTDLEDHPWWEVDLLDVYPIEEVVVYNRLDAAQARASHFALKIAKEDGVFETVYQHGGRPLGGASGAPARIILDGLLGRYVRIELPTRNYLHLDHVQVLSAAKV